MFCFICLFVCLFLLSVCLTGRAIDADGGGGGSGGGGGGGSGGGRPLLSRPPSNNSIGSMTRGMSEVGERERGLYTLVMHGCTSIIVVWLRTGGRRGVGLPYHPGDNISPPPPPPRRKYFFCQRGKLKNAEPRVYIWKYLDEIFLKPPFILYALYALFWSKSAIAPRGVFSYHPCVMRYSCNAWP